MKADKLLLADLVNMDNPHAIFKEVKTILSITVRDFDMKPLSLIYSDIIKLFSGQYHDYSGCTTEYHDLQHTTDSFLSITRLIHGAHVCGVNFTPENISLAFISSLMHHTVYIHKKNDNEGTGAKYTLIHVDRSISFVKKYLMDNGYTKQDYEFCKNIIKCSNLSLKLKEINFVSEQHELLGKMLGTSDIIGQIADRTYLEKLLFLFREFNECRVMGYKNELDLLKKTISFYEASKTRLANELGNVKSFMPYHFKIRWKMNQDLYKLSIDSNIKFLQHILQNHEKDYRTKLKRGGIVQKLDHTKPC
jgi:hypothetical protein